MHLKNFNPNPNVKYYHPCALWYMKDRLGSLGCFCPLTTLLAMDLQFIPVYSLNEKTRNLEANMRDNFRLGYEEIENILKYSEIRKHHPDFETGMENLISLISQNEMPIVCGTTYFLPYTGNYNNPKYIEGFKGDGPPWGHWLGVVGIENDEVTLFDTTPEVAIRKISKQDFKNFWAGDKSIPELADKTRNFNMFGYRRISVDKPFLKPEVIDLMKKSYKTLAYVYFEEKIIKLNGFVYYFGGSALKNFLEDLTKNCIPENMQVYLNCFFGMKFIRYFLRDTLEEFVGYCDEADVIYYEELRDSIQKIIDKWDAVTAAYPVKLLRDFKKFLPLYINDIIELNDTEKDFFSRMSAIHNQYDTLPKLAVNSNLDTIDKTITQGIF